ncbi:4950_t:CDS:2, partial [Cetraspora pellucida]
LFLSTVFLLPKSLIGILMSVIPFVGLISSPCWNILADRYDIHRKIMISCTLCTILAFLSLPLTGKYFGYSGLFISLTIYSIFNGGIGSLIDNLTINVLNRKGNSTEFGRQRLFGTISFGISIVMIGFIIDRLKTLYVMFFAFGIFMGLFLLVLFLTPARDFKVDHHEEPITEDIDLVQLGHTSNETSTQSVETNVMVTTPSPFMKEILNLFTKPRLLLFLFVILLMHMIKTSMSTFLYVFLSEDLKADAKLLGLSTFVGITLEIIVFYFGKYILESTFPEVIIIAGGIMSTLRAALYAFFGLEFGLVKPASLEIISQVSPSRLRATALGILAAIESLSTGLGQIVGGLLYGHFGAIKMFLYSTWIGIFAITIYIAGLLLQKRRFHFRSHECVT